MGTRKWFLWVLSVATLSTCLVWVVRDSPPAGAQSVTPGGIPTVYPYNPHPDVYNATRDMICNIGFLPAEGTLFDLSQADGGGVVVTFSMEFACHYRIPANKRVHFMQLGLVTNGGTDEGMMVGNAWCANSTESSEWDDEHPIPQAQGKCLNWAAEHPGAIANTMSGCPRPENPSVLSDTMWNENASGYAIGSFRLQTEFCTTLFPRAEWNSGCVQSSKNLYWHVGGILTGPKEVSHDICTDMKFTEADMKNPAWKNSHSVADVFNTRNKWSLDRDDTGWRKWGYEALFFSATSFSTPYPDHFPLGGGIPDDSDLLNDWLTAGCSGVLHVVDEQLDTEVLAVSVASVAEWDADNEEYTRGNTADFYWRADRSYTVTVTWSFDEGYGPAEAVELHIGVYKFDFDGLTTSPVSQTFRLASEGNFITQAYVRDGGGDTGCSWFMNNHEEQLLCADGSICNDDSGDKLKACVGSIMDDLPEAPEWSWNPLDLLGETTDIAKLTLSALSPSTLSSIGVCVLIHGFAPDKDVMNRLVMRAESDWSSSSIGVAIRVAKAPFGIMKHVGGGGSCSGPSVTLPAHFGGGSFNPVDACSGETQMIAQTVRLFLRGGIYLALMFAGVRILLAAFGAAGSAPKGGSDGD